jgi:transcriptional regulator with XRE-family HTH domain
LARHSRRRAPVSSPVSSLERHRLRRGWTQDELAAKSGLTQGAIATLERLIDPNPKWKTAVALSKALGVLPSTLFGNGREVDR